MEDNNKSADVRELRLEIARLRTENQKLKNSNRRWMRIAGTDIHTGLPNKVFFSNVLLPKQISNANAEKQSIGCIMLAPDGLGEINEPYGRRGVVGSKRPTGNQITTKEVVEDFLRRLQIMLDQAKQQGGNRIEVDEETHF